MEEVLFAHYSLPDDIKEKIEETLETKLVEYNNKMIPNVLFCNAEFSLSEELLEKLFDKSMIIRVSNESTSPFVFSINDKSYDKYENDFDRNEFVKKQRNNMDIFRIRMEKLLELKVTPSFSDIPNSLELTSIKEYLKKMVNYIEYINMTEIDHSIRVAEYAKLLAEKINYEDPNLIYVAGLLHDIGKALVPDDIRLAKRNLSLVEFEQMKQHPIYSIYLLNKEIYNPVKDMILYHHERCDGSGYPKCIKDIPLGAKILAIVDSYDAMTSSRIYDLNIQSVEYSLNDLKVCADKGLYDKDLVKKFISIMSNK